jgi:single-strand DNA-binding protein
MNQILLTGRVATEPRFSDSKTPICSFRIAVRRSTKAGEDTKTDFFTVVGFGGMADICHKYLTLGREVSVGGRLRNRSYVKDEATHWVTEIVADKVEFLGAKRRDSQEDDGLAKEHAAAESEQMAAAI